MTFGMILHNSANITENFTKYISCPNPAYKLKIVIYIDLSKAGYSLPSNKVNSSIKVGFSCANISLAKS